MKNRRVGGLASAARQHSWPLRLAWSWRWPLGDRRTAARRTFRKSPRSASRRHGFASSPWDCPKTLRALAPGKSCRAACPRLSPYLVTRRAPAGTLGIGFLSKTLSWPSACGCRSNRSAQPSRRLASPQHESPQHESLQQESPSRAPALWPAAGMSPPTPCRAWRLTWSRFVPTLVRMVFARSTTIVSPSRFAPVPPCP